jgi:peptidoglycan/LPS O-acetylase OafA/YrhL
VAPAPPRAGSIGGARRGSCLTGGLFPSTESALANVSLLHAWLPKMSVYFGLNSVTWSLSCELFFYLVFPLLIPAVMALV